MENKELISIEAAEKEWREFLEDNDATSLLPNEDLKNSKEKEDRDEYFGQKVGLEKITRAISRGLVIIEDGVVTQKLKYPIKGKDDGSVVLDKLVFKHRVPTKNREAMLKGIDRKDAGDALNAQRRYLSYVTGVDMIILGNIDMADAKITDQIVSVFFM